MKENIKLINAEDFIVENKKQESNKPSEMQYEDFMISNSNEGLVMRIFGDFPDYNDDVFEKLWQKVMDLEPSQVYDYCRKNGVNVLCKNGEPVLPWRDIAVMLMAIEQGIIKKKAI